MLYRSFVDWGKVGIGSPLKADDYWARQRRAKSTCFLSKRVSSLVDKEPVEEGGEWRERNAQHVSLISRYSFLTHPDKKAHNTAVLA
jgi:hypothetical protein